VNHKHIYKLKAEGDYYKECSCGKKRKSVRKPKKSLLKKKCDAAWSRITKKINFAKWGKKCMWCGKTDVIFHSDHVVNRWKHATRWNLSNVIILCSICHLYRKKHEPFEWSRMVDQYIPSETRIALLDESQELIKPSYDQILAALLEFEAAFDRDHPAETV